MRTTSTLIVFLIALTIGSAGLLSAKIYETDANTAEKSTLSLLAASLELLGIDTAYCCSTDHPIESGRARLAPLSDFKPHNKFWGKTEADAWAIGFGDGARGMIFAIKNNSPGNTKIEETSSGCRRQLAQFSQELCKFISQWLGCPPTQRVFIAFTNKDYDYALKVRQSLEVNGYTTFMFLKEKDAPPWADPSLVGELFAQSGLRLVIDTQNSRSSEGVQYESQCCSLMLDHTAPSESPSDITKYLIENRNN